jgi:hypothetical protein
MTLQKGSVPKHETVVARLGSERMRARIARSDFIRTPLRG